MKPLAQNHVGPRFQHRSNSITCASSNRHWPGPEKRPQEVSGVHMGGLCPHKAELPAWQPWLSSSSWRTCGFCSPCSWITDSPDVVCLHDTGGTRGKGGGLGRAAVPGAGGPRKVKILSKPAAFFLHPPSSVLPEEARDKCWLQEFSVLCLPQGHTGAREGNNQGSLGMKSSLDLGTRDG